MLVPFLLLVSSGPGQRILLLVHLRPQSPCLTAHVLPNGFHCQELLSEIPTCLHVCSFWTQPVSIAWDGKVPATYRVKTATPK